MNLRLLSVHGVFDPVLPPVVLTAPLGLCCGPLKVLACCVRSTDPAFPCGEGRVPLMVQALQGLFLLGARLTQQVGYGVLWCAMVAVSPFHHICMGFLS